MTIDNTGWLILQAYQFDGVILEVWMQFAGDTKQ